MPKLVSPAFYLQGLGWISHKKSLPVKRDLTFWRRLLRRLFSPILSNKWGWFQGKYPEFLQGRYCNFCLKMSIISWIFKRDICMNSSKNCWVIKNLEFRFGHKLMEKSLPDRILFSKSIPREGREIYNLPDLLEIEDVDIRHRVVTLTL